LFASWTITASIIVRWVVLDFELNHFKFEKDVQIPTSIRIAPTSRARHTRIVVIIAGRGNTADVQPAEAGFTPSAQIHWELIHDSKSLEDIFSGPRDPILALQKAKTWRDKITNYS
jgi:hypothetical protein